MQGASRCKFNGLGNSPANLLKIILFIMYRQPEIAAKPQGYVDEKNHNPQARHCHVHCVTLKRPQQKLQIQPRYHGVYHRFYCY